MHTKDLVYKSLTIYSTIWWTMLKT